MKKVIHLISFTIVFVLLGCVTDSGYRVRLVNNTSQDFDKGSVEISDKSFSVGILNSGSSAGYGRLHDLSPEVIIRWKDKNGKDYESSVSSKISERSDNDILVIVIEEDLSTTSHWKKLWRYK